MTNPNEQPTDKAYFIDYNHLVTTRPYDIQSMFISDLHLSADEPALVQAFAALLDDCAALPNLTELYILGDWFDAWIGDDAYLDLSSEEKATHWLTPLIGKLKQLFDNGCQTLVMHGNRDFLISQALCDTFNGQLIKEPYFIERGGLSFRLEHGDALCTDDVSYQRLRKVLRFPPIKWGLSKSSLKKRQQLATAIQQKSSMDKSAKSASIMDVNQHAVAKALTNTDILVHGHTHRPACHKNYNLKTRYVLGDWRLHYPHSRQQYVDAIIGITTIKKTANPSENFKLLRFRY